MPPLAVGFREHAGWAVAVLLADGEPAPVLVERLRFELCPPDLPREVHHAAAQLDPEGAKSLVAAVAEASCDATRALIERFAAVHREGIAAAGVPVGERPIPSSPSATRKAHTMMHAAEGQLYREALAEGCSRAGLAVHRFPRTGLVSLAADTLGRPAEELSRAIEGMGRQLGPPWARDQKDAAVCAWLAILHA